MKVNAPQIYFIIFKRISTYNLWYWNKNKKIIIVIYQVITKVNYITWSKI